MDFETDAETGLQKTEIDGKFYFFQKWGAEDALDTLLKLAKIVGRPLAIFLGDLVDEKDQGEETFFEEKKDYKGVLDKKITPDMIKTIFEALTDSIGDTKGCVALVKKFSTQGVLCDGVPITKFDKQFEGNLPLAFKVALAGLEVQYGNFFDAITTVMPSVKKRKPMRGIVNA